MTSSLLTAPSATITGREYRRVSLDRSGRARSVDEQGTANASAAVLNGITLGVPYVDNDRSASRYARKSRNDFAVGALRRPVMRKSATEIEVQ